MTLQQRLSRIIYLLSLALVLALVTGWFKSRGVPLEVEDPLRIVLGGIVIFFIPGLIWGEYLGIRPSHPLEVLSWSFIISLSIELLAMVIVFISAATISAWVYIVLGISMAGLVLLLLQFRRGEPFRFAGPLMSPLEKSLKESASPLLIIATIALMARGAYCWGEDLFSINGEKMLHLLFVVKYYSLPLVLPDLSVSPHVAAANMVNFWEFLLAGWARLIHCDPLPLFFRARFIIPLAGLPPMFLLTKSIIDDDRKAEGVFWTILLMVLGWWVLLSPSSLDYLKSEQLRGALAFMGTVHHADSAMDMLIAPCAALLFLLSKRTKAAYIALFAMMLSITFLWHVREFFQIALYAGILGLAFLLYPSQDRKERLKRWSVSIVTVVAVAAILLVAVKLTVAHSAFGYDEMALKKAALQYAFMGKSLIGLRNLFCFPSILTLSSTETPGLIIDAATFFRMIPQWQLMPWLAVSLIAAMALAALGIREERRFSLFYLLLWFLSLSWTFSMLMVFVLTYSEILIGTPRILYIFSYIMTGLGFTVLARYGTTEDRRSYYPLIFPLIVIMSASVIEGLMKKGFFLSISYILSLGALIAFVALVIPESMLRRLKKRDSPSKAEGEVKKEVTDRAEGDIKTDESGKAAKGDEKKAARPEASSKSKRAGKQQKQDTALKAGVSDGIRKDGESNDAESAGKAPWPGLVYLICLLFLLPFMWKDYGIRVSELIFERRAQPDWYGDNNPFGCSKELIAFIKSVPPNSVFLTDPFSRKCLFIYAPLYTAVMPSAITTLICSGKGLEEIKAGRHPLFRPEAQDYGKNTADDSKPYINHEEACRWLSASNVQYILADGRYYRKLSAYFKAHPEYYKTVFENSSSREIIVKIGDRL